MHLVCVSSQLLVSVLSFAVPTNAKNFNFFSHLCSLYSKTEIAAHTVNLKYNGSQHVYGQEYIILYGGTYNYYVL